MEELGKMVRVIGKVLADAPHEVLLVLDATTGAERWRKNIGGESLARPVVQ